jgi:hypothetical protein
MRRVDLRRVERSMAWIGVDWVMDVPKTVDALTRAGDEAGSGTMHLRDSYLSHTQSRLLRLALGAISLFSEIGTFSSSPRQPSLTATTNVMDPSGINPQLLANLSPAARLEVNDVVLEETRKAELQASTPSTAIPTTRCHRLIVSSTYTCQHVTVAANLN